MVDAIDSVFAVSMPSALHRHWLPSRSEVSTSCTSAMRHVSQESEIDPARAELGAREHACLEGEIRCDAVDTRRGQRAAQALQRDAALRREGDDLAEQ